MELAQRCGLCLSALPSRQRLVCANIKPRVWAQKFDIRSCVVSERMNGSQGSYEEEEDRKSSPYGASTSNRVNAGPKPLFDSSHVPKWSLPLLLYLPFGVLLAVARMLLWIGGILADAAWFRKRSVVSTYLKLLGFKAKWRNLHLLPKGYHVMVSNHTTSGDLMSLFELPQRYTHLITTAMPARVTSTQHLPVILRPATPDVYDELARQVSAASGTDSSMSSLGEEDGGSTTAPAAPATTSTSSSTNPSTSPDLPPVHLFPEGGLTNGAGMLQFSRGFMKFVPRGTQVVPVALRARTPFGIRTHTLNSSFLANLFWFSLCPWVEIEAVVLPPTMQGVDEGRGAFVQRVQASIAEELGVPISEITIQQKRALMRAAEAAKKTPSSQGAARRTRPATA